MIGACLGTSAEEIIKGVAIGVGIALGGSLGFMLALAIAVDNFSEAFSIGAMIREKTARNNESEFHPARRIVVWSSAPGFSVFLSALLR